MGHYLLINPVKLQCDKTVAEISVGRPGCRKFESFVGNLRGFAPTTHRKK
jgi:hypothetical protein